MGKIVRDGKTIFELKSEPNYKWTTGDDGALYEAGFYDGVAKALDIVLDYIESTAPSDVASREGLSQVADVLNEIIDEREETEDDMPCDSFSQVDEEENFDVCYNCDWHRLDHAIENR